MSVSPAATGSAPPISANAMADQPTRHQPDRARGVTSGSSTHGAMASGHTSAEVIDMPLSSSGLAA